MNSPARYEELQARLRRNPRAWLVTGGAGFIGSHLVEKLLRLGQRVSVLDNFATGHRANLDEVLGALPTEAARRFALVEGDIRNPAHCAAACEGVDNILHQAALGSVPRSLKDPIASHDTNVTGFLHVLEAARQAKVRRIVYASSSSVYGDHPALPKTEEVIGHQLSPYAVTKMADELYAGVFGRCYGLELIGLRYFNVFGPRQDPNGPYAAVIPQWFAALRDGTPVYINGDGETSRDFCYVENVVQANLLAATTDDSQALGLVYNVAFGARTTLNELFRMIQATLETHSPRARAAVPQYREFRAGDVRHSLADVGRARRHLGYEPALSVSEGLVRAAGWYAAASLQRKPA